MPRGWFAAGAKLGQQGAARGRRGNERWTPCASVGRAEERQPFGRPVDGAALWRTHAKRSTVPTTRHAERTLPHARGEEHGTTHAGGARGRNAKTRRPHLQLTAENGSTEIRRQRPDA